MEKRSALALSSSRTLCSRAGIQADGSFHQHGPLLYMGDGYGSHFTANVLATGEATDKGGGGGGGRSHCFLESATALVRAEVFAAGTPYTMGDTAWGVLMGFVLDGAQWASRGANW